MIEKFKDYAEYLNEWIQLQPHKGRGLRKVLSESLGIQASYFSQVLMGKAHLREEHAYRLNELLGHSHLETEYFMSIYQLSKASSYDLKSFYERQVFQLQKQFHEAVSSRDSSVSLIHQNTNIEPYYSSWLFITAHMLSLLDGIDTEILIERLAIGATEATNIIQYLEKQKLVYKKGPKYFSSRESFFLPKDHPLISKHHTNWKLRAIDSIQRGQKDSLHYTSVAVCSREDSEIIKDGMRALLRKIRARIAKSKEEELFTYSLDFYRTLSDS